MVWLGYENKRRKLVVEEMEEYMGRFFSEYGTPLMAVPPLKYLRRIFSYPYEYFPAVEHNLRRVQGKWG